MYRRIRVSPSLTILPCSPSPVRISTRTISCSIGHSWTRNGGHAPNGIPFPNSRWLASSGPAHLRPFSFTATPSAEDGPSMSESQQSASSDAPTTSESRSPFTRAEVPKLELEGLGETKSSALLETPKPSEASSKSKSKKKPKSKPSVNPKASDSNGDSSVTGNTNAEPSSSSVLRRTPKAKQSKKKRPTLDNDVRRAAASAARQMIASNPRGPSSSESDLPNEPPPGATLITSHSIDAYIPRGGILSQYRSSILASRPPPALTQGNVKLYKHRFNESAEKLMKAFKKEQLWDYVRKVGGTEAGEWLIRRESERAKAEKKRKARLEKQEGEEEEDIEEMEEEEANDRSLMGGDVGKANVASSTFPRAVFKSELAKWILINQWKLEDPDVQKKKRQEIMKREDMVQSATTLNLSRSELFLFVGPDGMGIRNLGFKHGIFISTSPETSPSRPQSSESAVGLQGPSNADIATALSKKQTVLKLMGPGRTVAKVKKILEKRKERISTTPIRLPLPASSLRPEVFETISKQSSTFIEPATESDGVLVTFAKAGDRLKAEILLKQAIVETQHANRRHLWALLSPSQPSSPSTTTPSSPPSPDQYDDESSFAMYPFVPSSPPSWLNGIPPAYARLRKNGVLAGDTKESFGTERMRWRNPGEEVGIRQGGHESLESDLLSPFPQHLRNQVSVKANLGHLVFGMWYQDNQGSLGPSLPGAWPFDHGREWLQQSPGVVPTLLASPSPGLVRAEPPFKASEVHSTSSTSTPQSTTDHIRRIVYRSLLPTSSDDGTSLGTSRSICIVEKQGNLSAEIVTESSIDVLVPEGRIDFRLTASHSSPIPESTLLNDHSFLVQRPPPEWTFDGERFFRMQDARVRRTTVSYVDKANEGSGQGGEERLNKKISEKIKERYGIDEEFHAKSVNIEAHLNGGSDKIPEFVTHLQELSHFTYQTSK